MQTVPFLRDHQQITGGPVPGVAGGGQPHPAAQHLQRGLPRAVVLAEFTPGRQGDQRLPKPVIVSAVHGVRPGRCATSARRRVAHRRVEKRNRVHNLQAQADSSRMPPTNSATTLTTSNPT